MQIEKVDAILEYLDRHTLFVELTAKSLKKDKKQTLDNLLEMFQDGKLPEIRVNRKESFDDYLSERFSLDNLDSEQVLVLKKLSLMPSVEIEFEVLDTFFNVKDLLWIVEELKDRGWLSSTDKSYKMHQIIKEFILNSYAPDYEEIDDVISYINNLLKDSADIQIAINNRANTLYFDSILYFFMNNNIENKNVTLFFDNIANIYRYLGEYEKALPLHKKTLNIKKEVFGKNHHATAMSYNNLAELYRAMGEYKKALSLFYKAINIKEEVLGSNHFYTAISYNNLGGLYMNMKEYKKALPLYNIYKYKSIWRKSL